MAGEHKRKSNKKGLGVAIGLGLFTLSGLAATNVHAQVAVANENINNNNNQNANANNNENTNSANSTVKTHRSYSHVGVAPVTPIGMENMRCISVQEFDKNNKPVLDENGKTVWAWHMTAALTSGSSSAGISAGPVAIGLPMGSGNATIKTVKMAVPDAQKAAVLESWCGGKPYKVVEETPVVNFTPPPVMAAPKPVASTTINVTVNEAPKVEPVKKRVVAKKVVRKATVAPKKPAPKKVCECKVVQPK